MNERKDSERPSSHRRRVAEQVERVCDRFEMVWRGGQPPSIEDFLISEWADSNPAAYRKLLLELVRLDLAWRWRSMEPDATVAPAVDDATIDATIGFPGLPRVEDYLQRFPALGPTSDLAVALIVEEYRVRRMRGDDVDSQQYFARFPEQRESLQREFASVKLDIKKHERVDPGQGQEEHARTSEIRYQKIESVAEGGLGVVSLARDSELRRKVALKEIKFKYAQNPVFRNRFLLEAEVTGHLEHPGIIPVYGLGYYSDGSPYYAMRYVRGENFWKAIKHFHKYEQRQESEGKRQLELHKLLRRFLDVCNAIDYAHSRGVLHRDLKPSNIMLGRHGETLVIDWGLAKLLDLPESELNPEESLLSPSSGSDIGSTRYGSTLGTPGYMSPEQASGRLEQLGKPSDVYGMGAVLYCVLTGRAPFIEKSARIFEMVKKGDFPSPRHVNPGVPRPLESICLKAMDLAPEQRYSSCKMLAADVENWMADEPVSCHEESRWEQAARWMRHHQSWVLTGSISLVVIALVFLAATLFVARAWKSESVAKEQAVIARVSETEAKEDAVKAKRIAEDKFLQARNAVDKWLTGIAHHLKYYPGVQQSLEYLLEYTEKEYASLAESPSGDLSLEIERGRTLLRLGEIRLMLRNVQSARAAYGEAETLFTELCREHPKNVDCLVERANCQTNLGVVHMATGDVEKAGEALADATASLKRLVVQFPDDTRPHWSLATALLNYGELLAETGQCDAADPVLAECIGLLKRKDSGAPNELSRQAKLIDAQDILARVSVDQGRYAEAVAQMQDAASAASAVIMLEPDNPQYLETGAAANVYLGSVLRVQGRYAEEADAYRQAVTDYKALTAALPGIAVFEECLALTQTDLGNVLHKLGRVEEAQAQLDAALATFKNLATVHPTVPQYLEECAYCQAVRGNLLRDRGELAAARAALEESLQIYDHLLSGTNENVLPKYIESAALSHCHLGQTLSLLREQDQAAREMDTAIAMLSNLDQPTPTTRDELAQMHYRQAAILLSMDKREEAEQHLQRAEELWQELVSTTEVAAEHRHHFALFLIHCPEERWRNAKNALDFAQQLTTDFPDNATYWCTLGMAYYRSGNWDEALAAAQKAISLRESEHGRDQLLLAMVRAKMDNMDQARRDYEQAYTWFQRYLPCHFELMMLQQEAAQAVGAKEDANDAAITKPN